MRSPARCGRCPYLRKQLATGTPEAQTKARAVNALGIADDLKQYEILTSAPEHLMGDEAYSKPLRNMAATVASDALARHATSANADDVSALLSAVRQHRTTDDQADDAERLSIGA